MPAVAKPPITASPHVFYVRPAPGWLEVVFNEVTFILKNPLQKYKFDPKLTLLKSTVKLHRCDWRQGLEVLTRLTTAHDVEWLILESKCTKWTEVDAILSRVPWNEILPSKKISVHVTAEVSHGFTTYSGKLRENLCKIAGVEHVTEGGQLRFKVELRDELLRILVSLAGDPLYKRGYKVDFSAVAPLPEHQAAACTQWVLEKQNPSEIKTIFVPFAGSGTFGFEALLCLSGAGVGAFPRKYSVDTFPVTSAATMGFLRKKMLDRLNGASLPPVLFNDFNSDAIEMLKANVGAFPRGSVCQVQEGDVFGLDVPFSKEGKILILLNPPYGDRLASDSEVDVFYSRLGQYLKKMGKANQGQIVGGCICPDEKTWSNFLKELGGSKNETHHFTHGGKEMRLVRFTL